jgi:hypothetical protein
MKNLRLTAWIFSVLFFFVQKTTFAANGFEFTTFADNGNAEIGFLAPNVYWSKKCPTGYTLGELTNNAASWGPGDYQIFAPQTFIGKMTCVGKVKDAKSLCSANYVSLTNGLDSCGTELLNKTFQDNGNCGVLTIDGFGGKSDGCFPTIRPSAFTCPSGMPLQKVLVPRHAGEAMKIVGGFACKNPTTTPAKVKCLDNASQVANTANVLDVGISGSSEIPKSAIKFGHFCSHHVSFGKSLADCQKKNEAVLGILYKNHAGESSSDVCFTASAPSITCSNDAYPIQLGQNVVCMPLLVKPTKY